MITEEQAEAIVERLINRIESANTYFLQRIGSSVSRIKELTPSEAQQLVQILKYGGSYDDIIREISRYTNMNIQDIDEIFSNYAKKDTQFAKQFYEYRNIPYTPFEQNKALMGQINALSNIAKNEMYNFARTNVLGYSIRDVNGKAQFVGLRETYNRVLDEALLNVGQGKETFDSAMTSIMRDIGGSGLKTVDFESGRSMRLDSKVRMDLKARLRELHNELQQEYGKEFDSDGIEISVHGNPAPDHALVQGRQFSNEEFEKLQSGDNAKDYKGVTYNLDHDAKNGYRPISEMNCYHYVFSIVLGVSKPEYDDEKLQEIIDDSNEKVKIDGKEYTRYECTQLQRALERKIREQKDIQVLGKSSDNKELIASSQEKITQLTNKYKEISSISGLPMKRDRLKVSGYKRIKVQQNNFKQTDYDKTRNNLSVLTDERKPINTNEVSANLKAIELKPKWCEVSESFEPEIRNRIITQINELNKQFPEAFEQDSKLRISPTMNIGEKEFAYITDNGIMFLNKRYLEDLDNLSSVYQKSVADNWNQAVPKGKELEGLIVHEFGHYYQNMQYQFSDEYVKEDLSITEYSLKIQDNIHTDYVNKNGVKDINVSMYGFSSAREWYAEMFLQHYFYPENKYAKNFYKKAIKGGK